MSSAAMAPTRHPELRPIAVAAFVLSLALPVIGLAVTYADPRFGAPCRPLPSGGVGQAFPTPALALVCGWTALVTGVICLAAGGWWIRANGSALTGWTYGRWVLIIAMAAIALSLDGIVLGTVYGTWVDHVPDCGW